jgi:carbon storage regulator
MLVLTRKSEQSIVLGTDGEIVISVLTIEGCRVRLGVSAPADVPIRRGELAPLEPGDELAPARFPTTHTVLVPVAMCR